MDEIFSTITIKKCIMQTTAVLGKSELREGFQISLVQYRFVFKQY